VGNFSNSAITEPIILQADLTIPLKDGGKIVIGPQGIRIVGTKKDVETPSIILDGAGISGYDPQGSLMGQWDAGTGVINSYGGESKTPAGLQVNATANGLQVVSSVIPTVNTDNILIAEFRAKFYALGAAYPAAIDLRTKDEGGTFAADGTTSIHAGCLSCTISGASYSFTSAAYGRWYYAWRVKNDQGWSAWSDGNIVPSTVPDYVEMLTVSDPAPPSGWNVLIEQVRSNYYVVRATRPTTNGNMITAVRYQLLASANGTWEDVDSGANGAVTKYNGAANNHSLGYGGARIILDAARNLTAANAGDLVALDVRGNNNFNISYCKWSILTYIDPSNQFIEVNPPFPCNLATPNYRCKVVKHPEAWANDSNNNWVGYFGDQQGHGYSEAYFNGDTESQVFVSPAIYAPTGANMQGRVWFSNIFSTSDDNKTHSTSLGNNSIVSPGNNVWNGFANPSLWIPVNAMPAHANATFANGSLSVMGTSNMNVAANTVTIIAGLYARGRFFPNVATGNLIVNISVSNFHHPQDWNATSWNNHYWGPVLMFVQDIPAADAGVVSGGGVIVGKMQAPGNNSNNVGIGILKVSSTDLLIGTSYNTVTMNGSEAFIIRATIGPGTYTAGTLQRVFMTSFNIQNPTFAGGNIDKSTWSTDSEKMTPQFSAAFGGIRIFIGAVGSRTSNTAHATITAFTLEDGLFYPEGAGGDPTFNTYTPPATSGNRTFIVTSAR
jgi:hypothetical protein